MCWFCGSPVKDPEPLGRSLRCADCGKDLRCCKSCRHYLSSEFSGGCAESQADKISEPDKANFCDWFSLNQKFRAATGGEKNAGNKAAAASAGARAAFDDLFK